VSEATQSSTSEEWGMNESNMMNTEEGHNTSPSNESLCNFLKGYEELDDEYLVDSRLNIYCC